MPDTPAIAESTCLRYGEHEETARELAVEASLDVLDEAGLEGEDVDGLFVANAFGMADKQGTCGAPIAVAISGPTWPCLSAPSGSATSTR